MEPTIPANAEFTLPSLRAVLRPAPQLAPEDSIGRFLQLLRHQPNSSLPVLSNGFLCGIMSQEAVLPLLETPSIAERERALLQPVAEWMLPATVVARPEMSVDEIGKLCAQHRLNLIPVVDAHNYCLGIVYPGDLLQPDLPSPRPARIGGMATPFGVYLTDGLLQAGAGNGALIATGALMSLLLAVAYKLVEWGLMLAQHYTHLPPALIFNLDGDPPAHQTMLGLLSIGLSLLATLIFLLLMRTTRLAGYHAAEHQTVHALERGEPLVPDVVRRMPRPHPRCGTNLMAAGLLWWNLTLVLKYVPTLDSQSASLFAALATVFTWRSVGTFLQERFTTKPATDRELTSGIAAGKALIHQYLHSPPVRATFPRKLWCMGILQVMFGTLLTAGVLWLMTRILPTSVQWLF